MANDKKITVTIVGEVDDDEIKALEDILSNIDGKGVGVEVDVDKGDLDSAEEQVDDLDGREVEIQLGMENFNQGLGRMKEGIGELKTQMDEALASAGKQETNKAFLEHAIGAEKAATATEDINKAVQKLPGDDTVMQGLLSQAVAKDASLTADELNNMGTAAADYFSAMSYYGKSSSEAFQDMNNYLLTGNTAELERSPILANHIDKLKEATSIQERSKILQEALNEEHWGGMSQQDTYNNKLETFNGMLERGQYNLGGMFQEGAKGAMDFALKLDDATGGWVGMGLAAAQFASPLGDAVFGLGQMAMGMKAIKDLGMIKYLKELEITTKLSAAADWLLSGAQAVLNFVMGLNPIFLVVIALVALAAALVWAYYNVDWFRQMVDDAWASLQQFGQMLVTNIQNAINQFSNAVQGIPQALQACLDWAHDLVMNHPLVQALIWLGDKAAEAFSIMGLGQGSPGKIYEAMKNELDWTEEAVEGSTLADTTASLGAGITDGFNPSLGTSNNLIGSGGNNITINIDNVDSEDRIRQIVQAVEDALAFDNLTAGRTV